MPACDPCSYVHGTRALPTPPWVAPKSSNMPRPGCPGRQVVVAAAVFQHHGSHHGLGREDWWSCGTVPELSGTPSPLRAGTFRDGAPAQRG